MVSLLLYTPVPPACTVTLPQNLLANMLQCFLWSKNAIILRVLRMRGDEENFCQRPFCVTIGLFLNVGFLCMGLDECLYAQGRG